MSVQINGHTHEFNIPDAWAGRTDILDTGNQVLAPMTVVLIKLSVAEGDSVQTGDVPGLMETMKMETSLIAPGNGKIEHIACSEGQSVEGGAALITLCGID